MGKYWGNNVQIDFEKLKNEIAQRYTLEKMGAWSSIINGDECLVWHVENESSPLIVRVSPAWRTVDAIQWVHDFMVHCGQTIPEVISPIPAYDNATCFVFSSCPVTVFPFIEGDTLNLEDAILREKAARLLARIHNVSVDWEDTRPRPSSKRNQSKPLTLDQHPNILHDTAFDAWVESLPQRNLITAPIHGDYYRRNILATDSYITGVIDWDEAHITYLMAEIGWCIWEFCQNDAGDDLNEVRARDFINAYLDETRITIYPEVDQAINFIRLRLRAEVVANLARKERSETWDKAYTEAQMRAFINLKARTFR